MTKKAKVSYFFRPSLLHDHAALRLVKMYHVHALWSLRVWWCVYHKGISELFLPENGQI